MSRFTKIIYIILFVGLLLMPHFSTHLGPIPRTYIESFVTLILFGTAYAVYFLHNRELARQHQKTQEAEERSKISEKKLIESFEYIGIVNRKLPLLHNISSDLLIEYKATKNSRKKTLQTLLNTAVVSIANTDWGLFRFIEIVSERTKKEIVHEAKNYLQLKRHISNKDLIECRIQQDRVKNIGNFHVISSSDPNSTTQTFLVLPKSGSRTIEEYPLLQAITDQAQLFYKYLFI